MKLNIIAVISLIVLTSIFDTINQLFLKSSINSLNWKVDSVKKIFALIARLLVTPRVWMGFFFCCLSLSVWLFVLSKADLNFAFSADSMHYIFIAFSSSLILKEKVGARRWVGTIFIVMGITLLTISKKG